MPLTPRIRHVTRAIRRASTTRTEAPKPWNRPVPARPKQTEPPLKQPNKQAHGVNVAWQALPWVLSSIVAGGLGLYSVQIYIAASKPCHNPAIVDLGQQKDVAARYDTTADNFDSDVEFSEVLMRVHGIRRRLAQRCKGHVLEVSCGTGRNLGYYDIADAKNPQEAIVDSLTLVDLSPQMVDVCKKKWDVLMSSKKDRMKPGLSVRFLTGSALATMPLAPGEKKYDTIIQTMGLCSTPSPTALLTNMTKHLDTSNPESRIFLLEHGRSYMPWLNNVLDNAAEKHAEIHGCWFNRDIGALVEDAAAKSGLEVVNERRYHLGTTWAFELKPTLKTVQSAAGSSGSSQPEQQATAASWRSWFGGK